MSRRSHHAEVLRAYYARCLAERGTGAGGVGWVDRMVQHKRFAVLLDVLAPPPSSGATLLDVGCGFGDLLTVITQHVPDLAYTGYDLSAPHLAVARQRHPTATFLEGDAVDLLKAAHRDGLGWDYVVACGTLNVRLPSWERWAWHLIEAMWAVTRHSLAFNLLSAAEPHPPAVVSVQPPAWLARCRTLSPHAALYDGYLRGDVTFCLPRT